MNSKKLKTQCADLVHCLAQVADTMQFVGEHSLEKNAAARLIIRSLHGVRLHDELVYIKPDGGNGARPADEEGLPEGVDVPSLKRCLMEFLVALIGITRAMTSREAVTEERVAAGEIVTRELNAIMADEGNFDTAFDPNDTLEGIAFLGAAGPLKLPEKDSG